MSRTRLRSAHRQAGAAGAVSTVIAALAIALPLALMMPAAASADDRSPAKADSATTESDANFSLAVIPDTQSETHSITDTRFQDRTEWLAEHREDLDLRFVMHTGDMVDWGWLDPVQYQIADRAMGVLDDAHIPYSLSIGNHDTRYADIGGTNYLLNPLCRALLGDACWSIALLRSTQEFNATFAPSRLRDLGGTFATDKVDNTYSTFHAGGLDWLVLSLEMYPSAKVVAWAKSVVEQHPEHNVIVTTHHYLNGDGSIPAFASSDLTTSPQDLYDRFISRYPNIKLVLSGHTGQTANRVDVGVHGNRIVSLLTAMHSTTTNPVRLIDVDTETDTLNTWIESPSEQRATEPIAFSDLGFVRPSSAPEEPGDQPTASGGPAAVAMGHNYGWARTGNVQTAIPRSR